MSKLDLTFPDDVMNDMPPSKKELIAYLTQYFDEVIADYDQRFQKRVQGLFGQPLSRYEKSILKDFLMDMAIGKFSEDGQLAAETIASSK